jgi:hypothetical protein
MFDRFRCELPGVETFDREHICIPVGWWLNESQVDQIIQTVCEYDLALRQGSGD